MEKGRKDRQGGALDVPLGSSPQREALFRRRFGAVLRELLPNADDVEDDVFKGIHQHAVRMAIADLAASLLTHAVDDMDIFEDFVWEERVDEMRDEMRGTILAVSEEIAH